MEDPEESDLNRRFKELFLSVYGEKKVNLYSSDATPRDKALCFLAGAVLAAQTTISIAKADLIGHVFILAAGVIFALFVSRKR